MRIGLGELPVGGLQISDFIDLAALNDRMAEGRDNEIIFVEPPFVELTVSAAKGGVVVNGTVTGKCRQPCSLCAEIVDQPVTAKIKLFLKPRPLAANSKNRAELDQEGDDSSWLYYQGDSVDIEEQIQEALILKLSPFWRPECDQHGCCRLCGINQRERIDSCNSPDGKLTLGEMLKNLGSK